MTWVGKVTRYRLIISGSIILLLFTGFLLRDVRAYRQAGAQPRGVNVAQVQEIAAAPNFGASWIRLNEPLEMNCSQSMGWEENGKTSFVILAYDQSKQQPFWLEYQGQHSCEEFRSLPLVGLLVPPDTFWIKQGMIRPPLAHPLVELKVGATPADLRTNIYTWLAVELIGIAALAVAYIARPKKTTPSYATAASVENAWSAARPGKR